MSEAADPLLALRELAGKASDGPWPAAEEVAGEIERQIVTIAYTHQHEHDALQALAASVRLLGGTRPAAAREAEGPMPAANGGGALDSRDVAEQKDAFG